MSWESIGSVSTGDMPDDEKWIVFSLGLAKKFIVLVCGAPPPGSSLDVMWHEHELGSYPSLGVWTDGDPPSYYISSCEKALEVFDEAVSWHSLKEHFEEDTPDDEEEEEDDDE
jgi:hypothetical protein